MKNNNIKKLSVFKNLFKLHWILLAVAVYSGAIAFGNFAIFKPQIKRYNELKRQKENLDEIYLKIHSTDIEQALKNLQTELENCRSLENSFKARIANKEEFSAVLGELNRIVKKTGVALKSIDPLNNEDKILGKYWKIPIKIRFKGSYSQFLSFLSDLEQSRYWLLIDSYNIQYDLKNPSNHSYSVIVFSIVN
ncbi:MAG: type 4a pilus biogenesis protein PilO [Bacteroidetes bacterium]|nr:type 4a pilus biogenesis protein PilO [Bacteroidota bacterium]MBL7067216.1 type 4a pilus biogenesis protein PilO [Candidatus Neomarinimicrobiota bacterium]